MLIAASHRLYENLDGKARVDSLLTAVRRVTLFREVDIAFREHLQTSLRFKYAKQIIRALNVCPGQSGRPSVAADLVDDNYSLGACHAN